MESFRDRRRAESFGAFAERYDATRPSYPVELIDWLTDGSPGFAVDVGCGTGHVARLLLAAGWRVLGVEVDARMAAVARGHGIEVEVSSFEGWQPTCREVDLVCSGQAWHWIDPEVGTTKAASMLRPGGRIALFWTSYRYDDEVTDAFAEVFGRHAPQLLTESALFGRPGSHHADVATEAIRRSRDAFGDVVSRVFTRRHVQSVDEWLQVAVTHSPVALLPDDVRQRAFAELVPLLHAASGGDVRVSYETELRCARRIA